MAEEQASESKTSGGTPAALDKVPAREKPAPPTNVWARVKEHKIAQWTLAYAAAAYALLDGTKILSEAFDWSHLLVRTVAALLVLGVPLVVTLAWYHGHRALHRVSGTELMIIALLLAIGGSLLWRDNAAKYTAKHAVTVAPQSASASIAVLAFSDLSAEGNQGYFSDGIAEEILNVLAHIKGLKVASRTSSFQFRKSDLGVPAIAQKLGVRYVLEGSVRKAGDTVRITAQLIDAQSDQHLWSQTFDRPLSTANLFAIQDDIASNIVEHLAAAMGNGAGVDKPVARTADTADTNAYDLYLKGHSLFVARSQENLVEAARILKAAVAKDPKFARAWETLAAVLAVSKYWGVGDEGDQQAASDAADTALRLNPNLSMAYAARGQVVYGTIVSRGLAAWDESMADLSRAIANDEKNSTAFGWRAENYAALGYMDRAAQDYQRCLDIDPAYDLCRQHLAQVYLFLGRTDEALRLYETVVQNGYLTGAVIFAPAIAARGDRLGALGALVADSFGSPQLIRPLFRALTDPTFSERDRQEAVTLAGQSTFIQRFDPTPLWILKAYDKIDPSITSGDPPIWWMRNDAAWLKSPSRKLLMQHWHLPDHWRKHGFPPQCKPIGQSDFECR